MSVVHPIERAWVSTGGTGARNYDEFADDAEITQIIEANPASALAIEMPHRAPSSVGRSFADSLPEAVARLTAEKADGHYAPAEDVVVLYRIGDSAYGLFAMVNTDQISTSADEPGLVIRNEDVFIEKVRERVALAEATQHLLSPVLLLQTGTGEQLHKALVAAVAEAGEPDVTDIDHVGRTHAVWRVTAAAAASLLELASGGELVVADGNHRSLAAQIGALPRFLAVITTPASVAIQPYHRLVSDSPVRLDEVLQRLGARPVPAAEIPTQGEICLYAGGQAYRAALPRLASARPVDNMDHALVERTVLGIEFGLEPGDKRITYVGGDYPPEWLVAEVDAGRFDVAILIAPVTVEEFVGVNLAREKMPRKSTWFTPKARGGLVLAELLS